MNNNGQHRQQYVDANIFRKERAKYIRIIASLLLIIFFLILVLIGSLWLHIKTMEQNIIIAHKVTQLGQENIELQKDIEYYKLYNSQD
mgnify:CR=1 FL=1